MKKKQYFILIILNLIPFNDLDSKKMNETYKKICQIIEKDSFNNFLIKNFKDSFKNFFQQTFS